MASSTSGSSSLSILKDWIENLAHRNRVLEEDNKILKKENWQLKMEIQEMENSPARKHRKIQIDCHENGENCDDEKVEVTTMTINPLDMPNIVKHLVSFMKTPDLLTCRLVNKMWNHEATLEMEKGLVVNLNRNTNLSAYLPGFLEVVSTSFPIVRGLKLYLDSHNWADDERNVRRLFKYFGRNLIRHELTLFGSRWIMDDFRDLFLASLEEIKDLELTISCCLIHTEQMYYPHTVRKMLPNLIILRIGLDCSDCVLDNHGHTQVFTDLIRMAPNLQTLYWRSWGSEPDRPEQDGSNNFIQSLLVVSPSKLENLFIYSHISDALVQDLAKSQLKLKQLYLVDYQLFTVHFVSPPGRTEVTPKLPHYGDNEILGSTLKTQLENSLDLYISKFPNTTPEPEIFCTKLLEAFVSAIAQAIA